MSFVGSSLWHLRQKIGKDAVVWPGVTMIVKAEDGQILLGRRGDTARWSAFGGTFELGDSAETCARRELQEETGLDAHSMLMFGLLTNPEATTFTYPNGHQMQTPAYFFEVNVIKSDLTPDEEHTELEWMDLHEALARLNGRSGYGGSIAKAYEAWLQSKEFQIF